MASLQVGIGSINPLRRAYPLRTSCARVPLLPLTPRDFILSLAASKADGVMSIPQALTAGDVPSASVVGQLVYRFGNGGRINSAVLQTKIGGEIYALQVYHPMDYDSDGNPVAIGDWLVLTGTLGPYGGVQQMQNVTEIRKASQKEIIGEDASAPQVPQSWQPRPC